VKWATFAVTRGGPNSTAACAATGAAVPGGGCLRAVSCPARDRASIPRAGIGSLVACTYL
jgi:hypothetical protein